MTNKSLSVCIFLLLLAIMGLLDSSYITYRIFTDPVLSPIWDSSYGKIFGVSVSILGIVAYVSILVAVYVSMSTAKRSVNILSILTLRILSGIGATFSVYLMYVSLFIIHNVCPFCVFSAVIMNIIFFMSLTIKFLLEENSDV